MHRFFEKLLEIFGWIQIFVSPFLISAVLSFVVYYFLPNSVGIVLAGIVILAGIIVGVRFANRIYRSKRGTIDFLLASCFDDEVTSAKNKK